MANYNIFPHQIASKSRGQCRVSNKIKVPIWRYRSTWNELAHKLLMFLIIAVHIAVYQSNSYMGAWIIINRLMILKCGSFQHNVIFQPHININYIAINDFFVYTFDNASEHNHARPSRKCVSLGLDHWCFLFTGKLLYDMK